MAGTSTKDCKITLGATQIQGIFSYTMSGVTTDMYEDTEFGDEWKSYVPGLKDGGTISFNGNFVKTDTTGQTQLKTYNKEGTNVTSIRIYVDSVSYYMPATTNPSSYVNITEWNVGAERGGLVSASFTAKISGYLILA